MEYVPMQSKSPRARVLMVDDEPRERLEVSKIVAALGYLPEMAADGEGALEKLGGAPVDAIVTDFGIDASRHEFTALA